MEIKQENIRNFSIIAHIDHGKSTLADRLIEHTGTISQREMSTSDRVLDSMDLEKERGITIKLKAVKLKYVAKDGETYILNLIDTPGHVDFTYEVSRSLAACEGAVLIVDASQGVEAQTLANVYLALEQDLEILPVINKIDLPSANIEKAKLEIIDLGLDPDGIPEVSAKNDINIEAVLDDIVKNVPAPKGDRNGKLRALIFDSFYDSYRGVVAFVRVMDGVIKPGMEIKMMSTGKSFEVVEVGYSSNGPQPSEEIAAGDVGFVVASIKEVKDAKVGDTITDKNDPADEMLPGYKNVTPMVYSGIFPAEGEDFNAIREALEKLQVNDASLVFEAETSQALGYGFRCGFLGLLHMEIIVERLEREFDLDIISTTPSVTYKVHKSDGEEIMIYNPSQLPDLSEIKFMEEPITDTQIMTPDKYIGQVMEISQARRGQLGTMEYIDDDRVIINYKMPLNEIIYDYFDALKSRTQGYASLDYEVAGYQEADLVKLDILINEEPVDALSMIVHRDSAQKRGRSIVQTLKEEIPQHQFAIPIQAAVGSKIIARETVRALRKDVTAKCYGGDISRKRKLLEKQKEGKKRMRQVGNVEVPQEAFLAVLKYDED